MQGGKHGENRSHHDEPKPGGPEIVLYGQGDDGFRIGRAHCHDGLTRCDPDGRNDQEQRQIDPEGNAQREQHRPREIALGGSNFTTDCRDEVKAL